MTPPLKPGPVSDSEIKKRALEVWKGLAFFAILQSKDPKKQGALMELHEPRLKVQELLDIIVPGYLDALTDEAIASMEVPKE